MAIARATGGVGLSQLTDGADDELKAWLKTRPASVQALAAEFPIGSTFLVNGVTMHLVGYTESDGLLASEADPFKDYEAAYATRELLCAAHFRKPA